MRKVVTFLGASLVLAWVLPSFAQSDRVPGYQTPDSFKDVPAEHWAYQAVDSLRAKGILIGYPDGLYRGKRTLTRYEFAVALKRLLDTIGEPGKGPQGEPGPAGPPGPAGATGEQGAKGEPGSGISSDDLDQLKKLMAEFKTELASIGVDLNAMKKKLDDLAKEVAAIKARLDKMLVVTGTAFMGMRSDRSSNAAYADGDGRVFVGAGSGSELRKQPALVHAVGINLAAKLGGDATAKVTLVNDNYKSYLGNDLANVSGINTNPNSDTWLDIAEVTAPFGGVGRDGSVTLGRMAINLTPLTLWKPTIDSYFQNPITDDGKFRMDGINLNTKLGSLGVQVFGGQTSSVRGTDPLAKFYTPTVGPGIDLDQLVGLRLNMPVNVGEGGHVAFTGMGGWSTTNATTGDGPASSQTNVQLVGADAGAKFGGNTTVGLEFSKTVTGTGRFREVNTGKNNAAIGTVGFTSGSLSLGAGYKYIDPKFYAPGFWGKVGNFINPTNIKGPSVRAGYDFSPSFGVSAGGEFYTAARKGDVGLLAGDSSVNRVLLGVRWDISKSFQTTVDWEGVYATVKDPTGSLHPTQQYMTFGTGYHLTDNTIVKLGYQIGSQDGKGLTSLGGAFSKYNYGEVGS